jgi:hypothetical protein
MLRGPRSATQNPFWAFPQTFRGKCDGWAFGAQAKDGRLEVCPKNGFGRVLWIKAGSSPSLREGSE